MTRPAAFFALAVWAFIIALCVTPVWVALVWWAP